jgi:hypothetical protein
MGCWPFVFMPYLYFQDFLNGCQAKFALLSEFSELL